MSLNTPKPTLILGLVLTYVLSTQISMGVMNGAFFLWLFFYLITSGGRSFKDDLNSSWSIIPSFRQATLSLFFTCLLSLVVAKFFPVTLSEHAPEITPHGFLKIWYLAIPFVLSPTLSRISESQWKAGLKTLAFFMILLLVIATIQYFYGWPKDQRIPTNPGFYHATLFFGHHLSTSSIIPFPTFLFGALFLRPGSLKNLKPLFGIAFFAGLSILFLSYARTAWLMLPVGIILLLQHYVSPKMRWAILGSFFTGIAILSQTDLMRERIRNSMGILDRLRLWEANLHFFKENPLTGIGWLKTQEMSEFYFKMIDPEHYREYFWGHAHNNFFEMLGGTGILGLIAFLFFTAVTLRMAWLTYKNEKGFFREIAFGLWVGLVILHLNGLTNVTFWEGKVMHSQMLALSVILAVRLRKHPELK